MEISTCSLTTRLNCGASAVTGESGDESPLSCPGDFLSVLYVFTAHTSLPRGELFFLVSAGCGDY